MQVSAHAQAYTSSTRIRAYGLDPAAVFSVLKDAPAPKGSFGIVLSQSAHLIKAGQASGYYLIAVVRGGEVKTFVNSHSASPSHLRVSGVQWV